MLVYSLFTVLAAVALPSVLATPALLTRTVSLSLVASALLSLNAISGLSAGTSVYSGLLVVTPVALSVGTLLLLGGAVALQPWAPQTLPSAPVAALPTVATYPLFVLFTTIGGTLLVSSGDLVTLYLAVELQSFAVYVMAAVLKRDSETATHSGLLYFLLGGLSSSLILLGSALLYQATGSTSLEAIMSLLQVTSTDGVSTSQALGPCALGFTLMAVGFLFKVTAAPFHHWGPDVYDGVPTVAATWLAVLPKVSILGLLVALQTGLGGGVLLVDIGGISSDAWTGLLLVSSMLSLLVGTVVGLAQVRIKRLLAYSTVSHVGFLLLALAVHSEEAVEAYLFYLAQYTVTSLLAFLTLLAFGYTLYAGGTQSQSTYDVGLVSTLAGSFRTQPMLAVALGVCLFSMAGVPPLAGFYAKQGVLMSALHGGYVYMAIVAVVVSVISASYYLRVVRVVFFDAQAVTPVVTEGPAPVTALHSYTVSALTMALVAFMASPDLVLDSTRLLAMTLYAA